jgi:hypothetical protein
MAHPVTLAMDKAGVKRLFCERDGLVWIIVGKKQDKAMPVFETDGLCPTSYHFEIDEDRTVAIISRDGVMPTNLEENFKSVSVDRREEQLKLLSQAIITQASAIAVFDEQEDLLRYQRKLELQAARATWPNDR